MCSAAPTSSKADAAPRRAASSQPSARSRSCASAPTSKRDRRRAAPRASSPRSTSRSQQRNRRSRHCSGELHRQEKAIVGFELQVAGRDGGRGTRRRKREQIATERRTAEEELRPQEARQDEARQSIARHRDRSARRRRAAEPRAAAAVRGARGDAGAGASRRLKRRRRTPRSSNARSALAADVAAPGGGRPRARERALTTVARICRRTDASPDRAAATRSARPKPGSMPSCARSTSCASGSGKPTSARRRCAPGSTSRKRASARRARSLDAVRERGGAARRRPRDRGSRSRAPGAVCVEAVQATLDEVAAEVEPLERDGRWPAPSRSTIGRMPRKMDVESDDEAQVVADAASPAPEPTSAAPGRQMTPDEMVSDLRTKIERMGAVNMMAIDQFDDLEITPHVPDDAAQGSASTPSPRPAKRSGRSTRRRRSASARRSRSSTRTSSRHSRRCSAAAAPASSSSTRAISSRAASTSSRSHRASGCRTCSCCRVARRR